MPCTRGASNEANGYVDLINAGYESSFNYLAQNTSTAENLTSPFAEPAALTVNSSGKVVLAFLSELGGVGPDVGRLVSAGPGRAAGRRAGRAPQVRRRH